MNGAVSPRSALKKITLFVIVIVLIVLVGAVLLVRLLFPDGCDHGMAESDSASNARGDKVGEYIEACTGFGTVVDYSIVLQPQGENRNITLLRHGETKDSYPKVRWIDDNTVSVDLGKVDWVSSRRDKFGDIRIVYAYTLVSPPP